jgi:hypothetical protein
VCCRHGLRTPVDVGSFDEAAFTLAERNPEPGEGLAAVGYPSEDLDAHGPPSNWFPRWQHRTAGLLTARGEQQLKEVGKALASALVHTPLVKADGSPLDGSETPSIYVRTTCLERTVASARAFLQGMESVYETIPEGLHSRPAKEDFFYPNYGLTRGQGRPWSETALPPPPEPLEQLRERLSAAAGFPGAFQGMGAFHGGQGLSARFLMDAFVMRVAEGLPVPESYVPLDDLRQMCSAAVMEFGEHIAQLQMEEPAGNATSRPPSDELVIAAVATASAPLFAELLDRVRLLAAEEDERIHSTVHSEAVVKGETAARPAQLRVAAVSGFVCPPVAEGGGFEETDDVRIDRWSALPEATPQGLREAVERRRTFPESHGQEPNCVLYSGHDSTLLALLGAVAGTTSATEATSLGRDEQTDILSWPVAGSSFRVEVYRRRPVSKPVVAASGVMVPPSAYAPALSEPDTPPPQTVSHPVDVASLTAGIVAKDGISLAEAADRASREMQRVLQAGGRADASTEKAIWEVLSPYVRTASKDPHSATKSARERELREREQWEARLSGRRSQAQPRAPKSRSSSRAEEAASLRAALSAVSAVLSAEDRRLQMKLERRASLSEKQALELRLQSLVAAVGALAEQASSRVRDARVSVQVAAQKWMERERHRVRHAADRLAEQAEAAIGSLETSLRASRAQLAGETREKRRAELAGAESSTKLLLALDEAKARAERDASVARVEGAAKVVPIITNAYDTWIERMEQNVCMDMARLLCRLEQRREEAKQAEAALRAIQRTLQQERALHESHAAVLDLEVSKANETLARAVLDRQVLDDEHIEAMAELGKQRLQKAVYRRKVAKLRRLLAKSEDALKVTRALMEESADSLRSRIAALVAENRRLEEVGEAQLRETRRVVSDELHREIARHRSAVEQLQGQLDDARETHDMVVAAFTVSQRQAEEAMIDSVEAAARAGVEFGLEVATSTAKHAELSRAQVTAQLLEMLQGATAARKVAVKALEAAERRAKELLTSAQTSQRALLDMVVSRESQLHSVVKESQQQLKRARSDSVLQELRSHMLLEALDAVSALHGEQARRARVMRLEDAERHLKLLDAIAQRDAGSKSMRLEVAELRAELERAESQLAAQRSSAADKVESLTAELAQVRDESEQQRTHYRKVALDAALAAADALAQTEQLQLDATGARVAVDIQQQLLHQTRSELAQVTQALDLAPSETAKAAEAASQWVARAQVAEETAAARASEVQELSSKLQHLSETSARALLTAQLETARALTAAEEAREDRLSGERRAKMAVVSTKPVSGEAEKPSFDITGPGHATRQATKAETDAVVPLHAFTFAQSAPARADGTNLVVRFVYNDIPLKLCQDGEYCGLDEAAMILGRHAGSLQSRMVRFKGHSEHLGEELMGEQSARN